MDPHDDIDYLRRKLTQYETDWVVMVNRKEAELRQLINATVATESFLESFQSLIHKMEDEALHSEVEHYKGVCLQKFQLVNHLIHDWRSCHAFRNQGAKP